MKYTGKMKYTGNMDADFDAPDCPLLPEILADLVGRDNAPLGADYRALKEGILARFRWVYHYNRNWGSRLVAKINGPTGGRDYLAMFFNHWAKALLFEKAL